MGIIKKINKLIFLVFLIFFIFTLFHKFPLLSPDKITQSVKNTSPKITKIDSSTYETEFSGVKYQITPHAEYEMYAVVVEQYDSTNWLDVTHKGDPAQTKDLCLVWGSNTESGVYREGKYTHGEFTCFYYLDRKNTGEFNPRELTNNHLIPKDESLRNLVKNTHVGDQVYIKGRLVDYTILDDNGRKTSYRKTSTTFEDNDCEVVLLDDFKIIKRGNLFYQNAKYIAGTGLVFSTTFGLIFFLFW